MPEHDNDRLEQFFRKAAERADVSFNEEDWKKLEVRLDAADAVKPVVATTAGRTVTAIVVGILLLSIGGLWLAMHYDVLNNVQTQTQPAQPDNKDQSEDKTQLSVLAPGEETQSGPGDEKNTSKNVAPAGPAGSPGPNVVDKSETGVNKFDKSVNESENISNNSNVADDQFAEDAANESIRFNINADQGNSQPQSVKADVAAVSGQSALGIIPRSLDEDKIHKELSTISSANAEKNKQEAVVELSGAEEADTPGAQGMVEEEHASDHEKHVAMPRLSLLLSFAPDFSSTSIEPYSAPGKAFGAVLHYHLKEHWSVSAGVIKNQKVYTGDGEDYTPPAGYWKYATNGIVPESIDGECSILEFPLMVQYVITNGNKNKFVVGAGSSSYLMQSESYRYHFSEPNPGAKEGWDSRGSSRFYFNMLNITAGYERQVTTGLRFGIEPYIKIPLEEIGWTSLKLYSMGASITMRYTLIHRKQAMPAAVRSRGPD